MKKKIYTIYALLWGKEAYIGKTESPRVSAVYHRHTRGEVKLTQRCAEKNPRPVLHVLAVGEMHSYEMYHVLLAFMRLFETNRFALLNSEKTIARSRELHLPAKNIFTSLELEGIEHILARTLTPKPTDADRKTIPEQETKAHIDSKKKLTLRIPGKQKNVYDNLASDLGITQEELLLRMIKIWENQEADSDFWKANYQKKIKKCEETTAEFQKRIKNMTERLEARDQWIRNCQVGVTTFFSMMRPTNKIPLQIAQEMYRDFSNADEYVYPESEEPLMFRPEAILIGKGRYPARFLLGEGDEGKKIKLRWYPNIKTFGISIQSSRFAQKGTAWIVGGRRAHDGAMDLLFSFPLNIAFRYEDGGYQSVAERYVADILHEVNGYNEK